MSDINGTYGLHLLLHHNDDELLGEMISSANEDYDEDDDENDDHNENENENENESDDQNENENENQNKKKKKVCRLTIHLCKQISYYYNTPQIYSLLLRYIWQQKMGCYSM